MIDTLDDLCRFYERKISIVSLKKAMKKTSLRLIASILMTYEDDEEFISDARNLIIEKTQ